VLMGRELAAAGVSIQYGTAVTERMLLEERPDKAILATGALSITPQIRGIDSGIVHDARDVLLGKVELKGPAVILGGGYVAMETADFCIERGIAVTVVEMSRVPPVTSVTAHGYWLNRRLKGGGTLMLGTTVTAVEGNAVVVNQDGRESRIEPVSMVIKALGAVSENDIGQVLKKLGIPYEIAGDAVKPRRLLEAVHEGDAAGRSIE
jgi:pyruvate/2-oxoglutarate dehydrogenase complex dihydrolipoamide dehydrogenase (E3) component